MMPSNNGNDFAKNMSESDLARLQQYLDMVRHQLAYTEAVRQAPLLSPPADGQAISDPVPDHECLRQPPSFELFIDFMHACHIFNPETQRNIYNRLMSMWASCKPTPVSQGKGPLPGLSNDLDEDGRQSWRLNLSECCLTTIDPIVFDLSALTHLDLHGNYFDRLPHDIARLSNLREVYLEGNVNLKYLPPSLRSLDIEVLWLFDCPLLEVQPPKFGELEDSLIDSYFLKMQMFLDAWRQAAY